MPRVPSESSNRSLLAFAATGEAVGIGLSIAGSPGLGAWVTIAALVLLIYSLHRLGRGGPDSPIELDSTQSGDEHS